MLSKSKQNTLGVLTLILLCSSALAQETQLPEVVIFANQAPTEADKVGSAVTVLKGDELRASGYTALTDALRGVPGVAMSQSAGRGSFTQTRVRGAEANHLLVTVDGVPMNDITDGDFNFADFALEDIERVEIIRGPQSGLYGANAHAGVIAIVTKSGRGLAKPQASVRIEGGSMGTGAVGFSARGSSGAAYSSVSLDFNRSDGYNVAFNGNEKDSSRSFTATAKAGVDFTPDFNVEGFVRYVRRHTMIDPQPTFGAFEGLAFDSAPDYNNFQNIVGRIGATWKMFDGALVQKLGAGRYQQNRDDYDTVFGYFKSKGHRDSADYKATLFGKTDLFGGEKHALTFATDWQNEFLTIDSESFMFDPAAAAFWAKGAERRRTGVAGEYALDLPRGTSFTAAIRHDWNSGFENVTTWRNTLSQKLPAGFRAHASVGTGVTNPTFLEQYGFFTGSFIGNPALKPEHSIGWDAGLEYSAPGGRFMTDVTYFSSRFRDKITLVGFPSTPINLAGVSPREGIEVTAKIRPLDWWQLSGTYTFTDSRLADGTQEIRRPRHTASGSSTVMFADGKGRATVNVVYNAPMTDTWFLFPANPVVVMSAYTTVGGIISYDLTPTTTAYVRADNIFNEKYSEVFSYRAPGFAAYGGLKLKLSAN